MKALSITVVVAAIAAGGVVLARKLARSRQGAR